MLKRLISEIKPKLLNSNSGINVVAFTGGQKSSLLSFLINREMPLNTFACLGIIMYNIADTPSLSYHKREYGKIFAEKYGIQIKLLESKEWLIDEYQEEFSINT